MKVSIDWHRWISSAQFGAMIFVLCNARKLPTNENYYPQASTTLSTCHPLIQTNKILSALQLSLSHLKYPEFSDQRFKSVLLPRNAFCAAARYWILSELAKPTRRPRREYIPHIIFELPSLTSFHQFIDLTLRQRCRR